MTAVADQTHLRTGRNANVDATAVKSLRALEWICLRDMPTGVTEMSVALGIAKSNAHRILATLASTGFVRHTGDGRYAATLKAWEIGSAVLAGIDFREVARPIMQRLSRLSGESVHISILDRDEVIYIDKVEGHHPVRAYSRIGGRAPAYAVATGKVLLAFADNVEEHLPDGFGEFTGKTVRSRAALMKELKEVRKTGYAFNRGEWNEGVCGLAAPVRNDRDEVICALGISGPVSRLSAERLKVQAPQVLAAAREFSHECGYRAADRVLDGSPVVTGSTEEEARNKVRSRDRR